MKIVQLWALHYYSNKRIIIYKYSKIRCRRTTKPFSPFNPNPVKVRCVCDQFDVFSSLQRPKRIGLMGSNGQIYYFLCKGEDDMKKDRTIQEIFTICNHIFETSSYTQNLNLSIQTYTVMPIGDISGIIEWASDTIPIKSILQKKLSEIQKSAEFTNYRVATENANGDVSKFKEKGKALILKTEPELYVKFNERFPSPHQQIKSRENYTKSMAVMSIVGSIIGLGDRHLDNILLNTKHGNICHIDFDLVFWKGTILGVPECVPFRLTKNMIDCFGPQTENGLFLDLCTTVLKVLRHNKDMLIPLTKTLLEDCDITYMMKTPSEKARQKELILTKFANLFEGKDERTNRQISERSAAEKLIKDAKSLDLLSIMFYGWSPFM